MDKKRSDKLPPPRDSRFTVISGEGKELPPNAEQERITQLNFVRLLQENGFDTQNLYNYLATIKPGRPSHLLQFIEDCNILIEKHADDAHADTRRRLEEVKEKALLVHDFYLDSLLLQGTSDASSQEAIDEKKKIQLTAIDIEGLSEKDRQALLRVIELYSRGIEGLLLDNPAAIEKFREYLKQEEQKADKKAVSSLQDHISKRKKGHQSHSPNSAA